MSRIGLPVRIFAGFAAALIAGLLVVTLINLAGGIPSVVPGAGDVEIAEPEFMVTSDVDPESVPGFLATPQTDADLLPDDVAGKLGVNPDSSRYQGEWNGGSLYLATMGTTSVAVVTGTPGDPHSWGAGNSGGNAVLRMDDSGNALQYIPQGTAVVPDGWSALSDWVIVKSS